MQLANCYYTSWWATSDIRTSCILATSGESVASLNIASLSLKIKGAIAICNKFVR